MFIYTKCKYWICFKLINNIFEKRRKKNYERSEKKSIFIDLVQIIFYLCEGGSKNLVNLVIFALARKSSLKFYFLKMGKVCCQVATGCVLYVCFLGPLAGVRTLIYFFFFVDIMLKTILPCFTTYFFYYYCFPPLRNAFCCCCCCFRCFS